MALLVSNKKEIHFRPTDLLIEAIEEFLESGANPPKIASCVIKIAIATELLLKDKLEKLCPALVLETIDEGALQVAKLYGLGSQMLVPDELEKIEIRTASFPKLLSRVGKFFDITKARPHLSAFYSIRNQLVHHRGKVDLAEVNLLIIHKIVPFLEQFTKDDPFLQLRLKRDTWKRLRQIADESADVVTTELAKKVAHFPSLAPDLYKTA